MCISFMSAGTHFIPHTEEFILGTGTLYLCATPIGNLDDVSFRLIKTLESCDIIACEDTRHTLKLLNALKLKKKLISYHEHNEQQRTLELINLLNQGNNIAIVSDAGMPLISDPGAVILNKVRELNINVTVIPGPNAALCALVLSGMDCSRFVFEGFLPVKGRERTQRLEALKNETRTSIIYESPHRLEETLKQLAQYCAGRELALLRELTKLHEECLKITLNENSICLFDSDNPPRGEYVLVLQGAVNSEQIQYPQDVREHVLALMASGLEKKEAVKAAARQRGVARDIIYKACLDL